MYPTLSERATTFYYLTLTEKEYYSLILALGWMAHILVTGILSTEGQIRKHCPRAAAEQREIPIATSRDVLCGVLMKAYPKDYALPRA